MPLPGYKGKLPVGVTTFTKPIRPTQIYSNARLGGKPALKLEEIAYAIYYPTAKEKARSHGVHWLPRPLDTATAGWAKFAGQSYWLLWPFVYLLARFIKLPAYGDAPLEPSKASEADQSSASSETLVGSNGKWPLVIFSHGLAGGRYTYSDYCGRLASQGMVVLAIEHRDGSGPMVTPIDEETGKPAPKLYIQAKELSWDNEPTTNLPIRKDQLVFRIREIYEAFASFKSIVDGNQGTTVSIGSFNHWDSLKGQVDYSKVFLTGHSFGGATSLSLLSSPPPEGHPQLPIEKVVLLDPWLDPLPLPGTLPVAYADRPPLLIMNSEGFTLWKEHFEMLEQLVTDWRHQKHECATLVTIVRCKHHFYSDFALFVPFGETKRVGMGVLDSAHKLTMAYFNGTLAEELKGKRGMEIEPMPGKDKYGEGNRQIRGQPGELIVH
ncbi:hypothetical protein FRC08_015913 [Ceratobasidium sp. 394]|nr:hypothetical protein FRC08_015913 [Ceratobasidium sp. 394]KAG9082098.1 hypothetical protein FS749_007110 [Ceratobasidium sp. UAMH 11750]